MPLTVFMLLKVRLAAGVVCTLCGGILGTSVAAPRILKVRRI